MKSNMFYNCVMCQLFLDFSDQIVRQDNLSVNVQGANTPSEGPRI